MGNDIKSQQTGNESEYTTYLQNVRAQERTSVSSNEIRCRIKDEAYFNGNKCCDIHQISVS